MTPVIDNHRLVRTSISPDGALAYEWGFAWDREGKYPDIMALRSESIVGVHLHRQIVGRVYKLHQQGELAFETAIEAFAHYIGYINERDT